ncbi:MAG: hypothetical protein R6X02_05975 [Enhygromyxa sp.]
MQGSPRSLRSDSSGARRRGIVLLLLLAPLPFATISPSFADEQVALDWGTYYGDHPSLYVQALAPLAGGVALSRGTFGEAGSGLEALAHFDGTGTLRWRAYYGGGLGTGTATALASAPELGLVYLVGYTSYDSGIATPEAQQIRRECFGTGLCGNAGFVAQFDASGELRWGTYFGGPFNDYIYDASAVADASVYVCGETRSHTNVATPGAHQETLAGDIGGFVARYGADGELQWASYVDGPCTALAANPTGDGVVIAGLALGDGDFTTPGAHQATPVGPNDAYLARFSAAGRREWGTYFGQGRALVHSLEVDSSEGVYVVGATDLQDSLVTRKVHQERYGGGESDLYIVRFTASGQRQWATYFGGESYEREARTALDGAGNLYFSATTASERLATIGGPSSNIGAQADVILGKLRPNGTLAWAVYYGGEHSEYAGALTFDPDGWIYLGGQTQSQDGIATSGAHREEPRAYQSGFLARLWARW